MRRFTNPVFFIVFVSLSFFGQSALYSQPVSDQISKALRLIEIGNPKRSIADLQAIVASHPKEADAHAAYAIAMMANGRALDDVEKEIAVAYDIEHRSVLVRTARGMLFGKEGKRDDAAKEFKQAIKLDEKNIGTYLYFARYYLSMDSLTAAQIPLYQAEAINANDVRPYIGLAEVFERQHVIALAIDQYEQAKKIDPTDVTVLAKLAGLYYRGRKYDESINQWIKITKIDSTYARAYYEIALIYFKAEQFSNAAVYAEKYLALVPNDMEGTWLAAQAFSESNQYQKALPYLEKASADDSLKNFTQLYLARGYFFSKDFAKANGIFSSAKNLNPFDMYYWGYSLISSGDTAGGIEKWRQSLVGDTLRKKEDKIKVYQQIISFLSKQQKWGDAAQEYLDMNSVDYSLDNFIKAGQIYTFGKQFDNSKSAFATVLQKDPKNVNALVGMADLAMKNEESTPDAEKLLDQAAAAASTTEQKEAVGEGYARLGIQYYTLKDFDKSVSMLESSHALKYLSASSLYLINDYKVVAAAYIQLKKFDKAEEYYKKALAVDPKDEDAKKGLEFLKQSKAKK